MKKLIIIAALLACLSAHAATNLLNLTYVNGTNNGNIYYASNIVVPLQRFLIQSLGITNTTPATNSATADNTNRLSVNIQISVDGSNTNWLTLTTLHPTTTNAAVTSFSVDNLRIALPIRAQVVTTNTIGVTIFTP